MRADLIEVPPTSRPVPLQDIFGVAHPDEMKGEARFEHKLGSLVRALNTRFQEKQMIVFTSSRQRAQDIAERLANDQGIAAAYHHAGLDYDTRRAVESGFKDGEIRVVSSTPTLAQGINLPATVVAMFDLSRWNGFAGQNELIEDYEILQMRGRAGRPQFDTEGYCLFLGSIYELRTAKRVLRDQNPALSQLEDLLDDKILAAVSSGMATTREEVLVIMSDSFAIKQERITYDMAEETIDFLMEHKFLEIDEGQLKATYMGNYSSKLYIKPRTMIDILRNINNTRQFTHINILKAFLSNWEILSGIRIGRFGSALISDAAWKFKISSVYIQGYDATSKKWISVEKTRELSKLMGYLLNNDFDHKAYISQGDLFSMKMSAKSIIQRVFAVLSKFNFIKDKITHKDITIINSFMDNNTSDPNLARLMSVPKLGEKTILKLKARRIDSVEVFLKTPNKKLKEIIAKTEKSLNTMKQAIVQLYPETAHLQHREKNLKDFL
jgi:replicative superfamily II helicase